jgi:hypothetical protein
MELFNCSLLNVSNICIKNLSVYEDSLNFYLLPPSFCVGKQCHFFHQIPTHLRDEGSEAQVYCSLLTAWSILLPTISSVLGKYPIKYLDVGLRKVLEGILL